MTPRIYQHRVNTLEALRQVPQTRGIEFDLRSDGNRVIVTHDAFTEGPDIEAFFPCIGARPCIFNAKCDGIEARVRELAQRHHISDYIWLDLAAPTAIALARGGERRIAVRYSEYEPLEAVLAFRGLVDWVWVDCFEHWPMNLEAWRVLERHFRICLVSPELQGHGAQAIAHWRGSLGGRDFHAVCTKRPEEWEVALPCV